MRVAVFLCDRSLLVRRVLRDTFPTGVGEGDRLLNFVVAESRERLAHAAELEERERIVAGLSLPDEPDAVPAIAVSFHENFLVVAGAVDGQADFNELAAEYAGWLDWAERELPVPYQDGYYRIQRINNKLLNTERALAKKNSELERMLDEVRDANGAIALLERDRLTNLNNTAGLLRRARRLTASNPGDEFDAVAFSIEGFRQVKEVLGREAGDELLRSFALFLQGLPGIERGVLARATAATFFAFMPSDVRFAREMRDGAQRFLADYPMTFQLHVNIGVCERVARPQTADEAINRAHMALDAVGKRTGTLVRYDESMVKKSLREHQILDSVSTALSNGDFKLYVQPKVDMTTGAVVGGEALVRWRHRSLGFLPPADFIPLLERKGRIYEVDRFVWKKACELQRARADEGRTLLPISVNVARGDFYEPDLVDALAKMLDSYGLDASALRVEALERSYVQDTDRLVDAMGRLRAMGLVVEMDDFGTGASSLSALAEMPVDVLKLDRSFVMGVNAGTRQAKVLESIVSLAHGLGLEVIAEGIETKQQERLLISLGCRYGQGYLYCKPQAAEYFAQLP